MADIRRGIGADNRVERLPWLEPVEADEDGPAAPVGRRWAVLGAAVLLLAVLAAGGWTMWRRWHGTRTDVGGIIRAPAGPYKMRPDHAGGLAVDEGGVVAEQTGTGVDIDAPLALVAPEQPVVGPGAQPPAPSLPAAAGVVPVAPPAVAAPGPGASPVPAMGGGTVQLGAFSSEAKARAAWKSLSRRFGYLQPMTSTIAPAESNGTTVFRLRASGGEPAPQVCARLQVAGEACAVIG